MLSSFYYYWDYWALYNKVTFDGDNRLIIINEGVAEIDVRRDIYSAWKEWVQIYDNSKYLAAIRTTGGDPIGGGQFTGDVYFLINNWQILVNDNCVFTGVIYSDNFPSPFSVDSTANIVTNVVSSLVNTIQPIVNIDGSDFPTNESIAQAVVIEMDTNSVKLESIENTVLAHTPILNSVNSTVTSQTTLLNQINNTITEINSNTSSQNTTIDSIATGVGNIEVQLTTVEAKVDNIPAAVRIELAPELAHLMQLQNGQGLDSTQATMLLEIYRLYGLDPMRPLVVTATSRTAGDIAQNIQTDTVQTTVTRV